MKKIIPRLDIQRLVTKAPLPIGNKYLFESLVKKVPSPRNSRTQQDIANVTS